MKKVVCILSDAFRFDYIDKYNLQFFKESIKRRDCFYAKKIVPGTGFCEIIDYVSGKGTTDHQMLTQLNIKSNWGNIPRNKWLEFLAWCNSIFPCRKIPVLNKIYNQLMDKLILRSGIPQEMVDLRYNVPINILPFIELVESKYSYDSENFGGKENIFRWMKKRKIEYEIDDFVEFNKIFGTNEVRLNNLKAKIYNRKLKDFTLLYIGYGELAHFEGTNSKKLGNVLNGYTNTVEEINILLSKNYDDFVLIILGDHGMIDVSSYIDVGTLIDDFAEEAGLRYFDDYIYFLDSTLCRIWLKDRNNTEIMESKITTVLTNYIENGKDVEKYFDHFKPRYGDIILLLKPGAVFFPDFFNLKKNKAMHGYWNLYDHQASTMLVFGNHVKKGQINKMHLYEVNHYLKKLWEN